MTALVLGLVTASAKSSFDNVSTAVSQTAMDVVTLDRLLARYGAETGEIRQALQHTVAARIDAIWGQGPSRSDIRDSFRSGAAAGPEKIADAIRSLTPKDDSQRSLQARALEMAESLLQARWIVLAFGGSSVPLPFLLILMFWLAITFTSFGLFAPRNMTVFVVFVVCALSVGSAAFLILELDAPFEGWLRVSSDPMRYAQGYLNQ
jgi:hypothetical protein